MNRSLNHPLLVSKNGLKRLQSVLNPTSNTNAKNSKSGLSNFTGRCFLRYRCNLHPLCWPSWGFTKRASRCYLILWQIGLDSKRKTRRNVSVKLMRIGLENLRSAWLLLSRLIEERVKLVNISRNGIIKNALISSISRATATTREKWRRFWVACHCNPRICKSYIGTALWLGKTDQEAAAIIQQEPSCE